jgi:hypothetical protein
MATEGVCPYCDAKLKGSEDVEHMWLTTIKHGRVYLILCRSCRKVLGAVGGGL